VKPGEFVVDWLWEFLVVSFLSLSLLGK